MKLMSEMSTEELENRAYGSGSEGDIGKFEYRAAYHRRQAARYGFLIKSYHKMAAGANSFWNSLSF